MINTLSCAVIIGVLSASGAAFLKGVSEDAEQASGAYVSSAEARFQQYHEMMPGIVAKHPLEPVVQSQSRSKTAPSETF